MSATAHPAPERHRVSLAALWFGLFGAPAAWSLQLLADYPTDAHGCFPHLYPLAAPTIGNGPLSTILVAISIAAVLMSAGALFVSLKSYRATRGETGGEAHHLLDVGEGRTRFMALSGVMLSTLFLLATLVHAASLLLLPGCSY